MRVIGLLLVVLISCLCYSQDNYRSIDKLLLSLSHMDIVPPDANLSVEAICGSSIDEMSVTTNRFFDVVREYCTNLCSRAAATNEQQATKCKGALNLLRDYDPLRSNDTFAFCATNSTDATISFVAALSYAEHAGLDQAAELLRSSQENHAQQMNHAAIGRGIIRSFERHGGSAAETNKAVLIVLDAMDKAYGRWHIFDKSACRWWPDYATSSNRYLAAQRALQVVPPPASSNYLNRVIAELEALPPGTMHLLPTNHLGTAWSEE